MDDTEDVLDDLRGFLAAEGVHSLKIDGMRLLREACKALRIEQFSFQEEPYENPLDELRGFTDAVRCRLQLVHLKKPFLLADWLKDPRKTSSWKALIDFMTACEEDAEDQPASADLPCGIVFRCPGGPRVLHTWWSLAAPQGRIRFVRAGEKAGTGIVLDTWKAFLEAILKHERP